MGVDIFARSNDGSTAQNLAVKSHQSAEHQSAELADYLATRQGW